MDTYDAIYSRRTIRDFEPRAIEQATVERLLSAGLRAPSNDHLRNWEFLILDDLEVRREAVGAIKEMTSKLSMEKLLDDWGTNEGIQRQMYLEAIPKQRSMLLSAGALIIPWFKQERPLLQPKSLSSLNAFASIWCCIENILVAAAAEGIYGVTRIPMQREVDHIRKLLNVPDVYAMACYLALGYPGSCATPVEQYEYDVRHKMHSNCWQPA